MAIIQVIFASEALCRYVNLNVIVPVEAPGQPGAPETLAAKAAKPAKFKTLYLLHGYGGNQNDWMTYANIRALAEQYNLAVVMPAGENSFYVDGEAAGTRWGEMVGKEVVEFTRRLFPLSDRREDTFIGGLSMGGFGAVRLGSFYHDTFSKIFSLSGAFVVDDVASQKPGYADGVGDYAYYIHTFGDLSRLKNSPKDPLWCVKQAIQAGHTPQIYMACGDQDFLIRENRSTKKQLEQMGVDLFYQETPGIHDWKFWNHHLEPAIRWLLKI